MFTVLPVAVVVKEAAAPSAATAFAICIVVEVFLVEFERVSDTQATVPLAMGCALYPQSMHVALPGVLSHVICLLAAWAAELRDTEAVEKSVVE
jgi:hypothetical protein